MSKPKSLALILGVLIMSFLIGYLVLAWLTRPIVGLCFLIGILTLIFKNVLLGIVIIIAGVSIMIFFGGRIEKFYSNSSAIESSSQQIGSHKLMRIVADEMSRRSTMEQIVEALKREIRDTLEKTSQF